MTKEGMLMPKTTTADTNLLKVACTGDSRAVLGRRNKRSGLWEAVALSEDQTGYNENERRRLQREHPNEPDMIKGGRILGLAVTRAFGDARWNGLESCRRKPETDSSDPSCVNIFEPRPI